MSDNGSPEIESRDSSVSKCVCYPTVYRGVLGVLTNGRSTSYAIKIVSDVYT